MIMIVICSLLQGHNYTKGKKAALVKWQHGHLRECRHVELVGHKGDDTL